MKVVELVVQLAGPYPLRLTELAGSGPLASGTRLAVEADLARALLERHPGNLKATGAMADVASLSHGVWGPVAEKKAADVPKPTETHSPSPVSRKGSGSNKSMARKPAAEAKV